MSTTIKAPQKPWLPVAGASGFDETLGTVETPVIEAVVVPVFAVVVVLVLLSVVVTSFPSASSCGNGTGQP